MTCRRSLVPVQLWSLVNIVGTALGVIFFAAACCPSSAEAQSTLTLAQAQEEARAHAPEGRELEALVRGASAIASDARRAVRTDPTLSTIYRTGAVSGGREELAWEVGLDWTVDVSGSWRTRGASAESDLVRATAEREDGLRALDEAVAVHVAELAFAERQLARGERIAALQELAAFAARRELEVGQGTQLDVDAAELELAAARVALAQGSGERDRGRARLGRWLGREGYADLVVEDPLETADVPPENDLTAMVARDPRVRAAEAELKAARLDLETNERMVWPAPSFGLSFGYAKHDIPAGSFSSGPGLEALWTDWELGFALSFPVALVDRRREPRVRSQAVLWSAEARLPRVRADVRTELQAAWADLRHAADGFKAVEATAAILERDYELLDKAVRAGALDAVTRAQLVRRLIEAGGRLDSATRGLRAARARWIRRTGSMRIQPR